MMRSRKGTPAMSTSSGAKLSRTAAGRSGSVVRTSAVDQSEEAGSWPPAKGHQGAISLVGGGVVPGGGLHLARELVEQHSGTQDPQVVARDGEEVSVARGKSVGP